MGEFLPQFAKRPAWPQKEVLGLDWKPALGGSGQCGKFRRDDECCNVGWPGRGFISVRRTPREGNFFFHTGSFWSTERQLNGRRQGRVC